MKSAGSTAPHGYKAKAVRVTDIGEFIRHKSCQRRFALGYQDGLLFKQLPFASRHANTMDPVLARQGKEREERWARSLEMKGFTQLKLPEKEEGKGSPWELFAEHLRAVKPGQRLFARELQVSGVIGEFKLFGRIDFTILRWTPDDTPILQLVECKASRKDRTYQRVQVVLYLMMLSDILDAHAITVAGHRLTRQHIITNVVRIDERTNQMMDLDHLPIMTSVEALEADIKTLLARDGLLDLITDTPLDDLPFRLESKCDDCQFHVHCFAESTRERRLELLGLSPDITQALRDADIDTIDALANLPLDGTIASSLRHDPDFFADLDTLKRLAAARRSTLWTLDKSPGKSEDIDQKDELDHQVTALPDRGYGQLPAHTMRAPDGLDDLPLLRVFLDIHHDYAEDRIAALAAHITLSDGELYTPFERDPESHRFSPSPNLVELYYDEQGDLLERPVQGESIVHIKHGEWSGDYVADCATEQSLLRAFFAELVEKIQLISSEPALPMHFYVHGHYMIKALIAACERVGGNMLGFIRELFGCRDTLEQLIYSDLGAEVQTRYAWGWTGQGLSVVTSLNWFGRRFHWHRAVGRETLPLDRLFRRDIFDFRAILHMNDRHEWLAQEGASSTPVQTELRSRFHDNLPAPYLRAFWKVLPNPDDPAQKGSIPNFLIAPLRDYYNASKPGALKAYFIARVEAMRWLEERIKPKNNAIRKIPLPLDELPHFSLQTNSAAQAAIDFMRLDQHVKFSEWLQAHFVPPYIRISRGESLPVQELRVIDERGLQIEARINPVPCYMDLATLQARTSIDVGKMIRLSPADPDPRQAQSPSDLLYRGRTAFVQELDWSTGLIKLSIIPSNKHSNQYYTLRSDDFKKELPFSHGTLDAGITNFVDARVEKRLLPKKGEIKGAAMLDWFDPYHPQIPEQEPVDEKLINKINDILLNFRLTAGDDRLPLSDARRRIILAGLASRVQLIQGPPGTGKTMVSALAILTRVLARHPRGQLVVVSAHTHTAVETLLRRIDRVLDDFKQALATYPELANHFDVTCAKLHSSDVESPTGGRVLDFSARGSASKIAAVLEHSTLVIGSTTSTLLKFVEDLNKRAAYKNLPDGFQTPFLIIDEASMMVCAHLLALVTCLRPDGEMLLAGDHRQLAPIMAHDWEREDRPPAQLYRMHESAFEAIVRMRFPIESDSSHVQQVRLTDASIRRDGLEVTYRLPDSIRRLIQPLYDRDNLQLRAPETLQDQPVMAASSADASAALDALWKSPHTLYLVAHHEQASRLSNDYEAYLIKHMIDVGLDEGIIEPHSIAIVTPHRAQRALLKTLLEPYSEWIIVIDTVERLQGGEAETIFFSATVSEPTALSQETEFILNLERSNVAFSRTKRRLIVLASHALLNFVPPRLEDYQDAVLWKQLRAMCTAPLTGGELSTIPYQVLVEPPESD